MREQFRPYTMIVDLTTATPSGITLTDSGGAPLACNFVSVEGSGTGNTLFSVIISGIGVHAGVDTKDAANMQGTTSGVIGGAGRSNQGIVELVLADRDRVSEITLSQSAADPCRYILNYGEVYTGNPLRDQNRPKGN